MADLRAEADQSDHLGVPPVFTGREWYLFLGQLTDADVLGLLA
jgi:hypothetical protein